MKYQVYALLVASSQSSRQKIQVNQKSSTQLRDLTDATDDFYDHLGQLDNLLGYKPGMPETATQFAQSIVQIKSGDDPVCPSSGCPKRDMEALEDPFSALKFGNYTSEGSWEIKNVTQKPLGDEWNKKGSPGSLRAQNDQKKTTLAQISAQAPSNSSVGEAGCKVHHENDLCNYAYDSGVPKMRWDRVSIQTPEYVPGANNKTAADGTAPMDLVQLTKAEPDMPMADAVASGCSKHKNNDGSCPYKGPKTGIKMVYDNVFQPAIPPGGNTVQADGTSGGTLAQVSSSEDPPAEAAAQTSGSDIPCSSHQASVGTGADSCDYTPDLSNFKKAAYSKVYMSGAKTNATYAAQISPPNSLAQIKSSAPANPSIPCSSHQASVGTNADECDYTPDLSNFKKAAYSDVYMSGSKTNATYAAQVSQPTVPCDEHQINENDCNGSNPKVQAYSTQAGRKDPRAPRTPAADAVPETSAVQIKI